MNGLLQKLSLAYEPTEKQRRVDDIYDNSVVFQIFLPFANLFVVVVVRFCFFAAKVMHHFREAAVTVSSSWTTAPSQSLRSLAELV